MTKGCEVPTCGRSPAKKSSCCGMKLCEEHAESAAAHSCPTQARLLAMTPAQIRQWKRDNAPEETLTTQVIAALNLLPGVCVWRTKNKQGSCKSDDLDGVLDISGYAGPDGIAVFVETKRDCKDGCVCASCTRQRRFAERASGAGCAVVLNARTVQAAIDGVRMALAVKRGSSERSTG